MMENAGNNKAKEGKFISELLSLKEQMRFKGSFEVPEGTRNIVVAGMGGSGVVGRIFKEMYSRLPVCTVNGYMMPDFIDENTLAICISYSGNTEETISAYSQAVQKGARTVIITSGGALGNETSPKVIIPAGISPRSALGYMLMPLLRSFGLVTEADIEEAYRILDGMDADNSREEAIAREIFDGQRLPLIYGTSPNESIAYRWSTQFNENAKVLALWSGFPELNHNHTMALKGTYRMENIYSLCIVSSNDKRVLSRIKATEEVTGHRFMAVMGPRGVSELARIMYLVHAGDYVSYHLARLRGVDPLDVSVIESLKEKLKPK